MTQTQVKPRGEELVVAFLVQKKSEGSHGLQLEGKVAQFLSDYPTILTPVDELGWQTVKVGLQYQVVLQRGSLKTDREKRPLPAGKDFNYFWDWVRLATTADLAQVPAQPAPWEDRGAPKQGRDDASDFDKHFPQPPEEGSQPQRAPEGQGPQARDGAERKGQEAPPRFVDQRDLSIQRQVALKAAVEMAGHRITAGNQVLSGEVLQVAEVFAEFLQTGKVPKAQKGGA